MTCCPKAPTKGEKFHKEIMRLIPLLGLPIAFETAEHMFNHVFRYYGIIEDVVHVSDRGPQLIFYLEKLGFTVSGPMAKSRE